MNLKKLLPNLVIWLALVGILANGFSVLLLKKDSEDNMNMKSAYLHLLTDMMASVSGFNRRSFDEIFPSVLG